MNESAYAYNDSLSLYHDFFVKNGKPVVNVEYKGRLKKFCSTSKRLGILTLRKKDYFKGWEKRCR